MNWDHIYKINTECVLRAWPCFKCIHLRNNTTNIRLNAYEIAISVGEKQLNISRIVFRLHTIVSCYKWRNWGTEGLSNLPKENHCFSHLKLRKLMFKKEQATSLRIHGYLPLRELDQKRLYLLMYFVNFVLLKMLNYFCC